MDCQNKTLHVMFGTDKSVEENKRMWKDSSNKIRTTRYTALNWIPRSVLWQFRKLDNFYFMFLSMIYYFPFSPKKPLVQIATYMFLLFFALIQEAIDDYHRYKQDNKTNSKAITLVSRASLTEGQQISWESIKLGQIIMIKNNEEVPADVLILKSSNPNGLVYVDTKNIDGETNLKAKITPDKFCKESLKIDSLCGQIACDEPNPNLESWNGSILTPDNPTPSMLNIKNLVLRGCYLRNTTYLVGIVLYIGHETKIMKNSKLAPSKSSGVLSMLNILLTSIFIFQISLILVLSFCNMWWQYSRVGKSSYLEIKFSPGFKDFFVSLLSYWIAYSHLINASMCVVLQIVKIVHTQIINKDPKMYDPEIMKYTQCRTTDLIEELGQVQFVFTDKTGTLTCNKMNLKMFHVNGVTYSVNPSPGNISIDAAKDQIQRGLPSSHPLYIFGMIITLCHTVFLDTDSKGKTQYQASSSDELALVQGAELLGLKYINRTSNIITIEYANGTKKEYELLDELPFDNYRKRMTVIIKEKDKPEIFALTKGADSSILPIIDMDVKEKLLEAVNINRFAISGLRTLAFAYKILDPSIYFAWNKRLNEVSVDSMENRETRMANLYDEIEHNFIYIGASAIEDMLQDGVPETLSKILDANIRVWVLTGDKQETAVEIGKACQIISPTLNISYLSETSDKNEGIEKKFETLLYKEASTHEVDLDDCSYSLSKCNNHMKRFPYVVVIDGATLSIALSPKYSFKFFKYCLHAKSVICCRVSPKQKAEVVELVKNNGTWKTLAIGDGANDVPMLMEANVGIGIRGLEGAQAVLASDYAICKFRFLQNMLFFYGRCSYIRVSEFLCFYFYKNCICVFTELGFEALNGFSGQIFFHDMLLLLYNISWSCLPCVSVYCLEFDVNYEESMRMPFLYTAGPQKYYFNLRKFWKWLMWAIWHGIASFVVSTMVMKWPITESGVIQGHWVLSTVCFTVAFHVSNFKLYLEARCWHALNIIAGLGSILLYHSMIIMLSYRGPANFLQPEAMGIYLELVGSLNYWIMALVVPFAILLPDIIIKITRSLYFPDASVVTMRKMQLGGISLLESPTKDDASFSVDMKI